MELEILISQLDSQLKSDKCNLCSQEISAIRKAELDAEIRSLKNELAAFSTEQIDPSGIQQDRKILKSLSTVVNIRLRLADLDKDLTCPKNISRPNLTAN